MPVAAAYLEERGLLKYVWETRVERGPYVAEREDAAGTYFRGPQGGVSYARQDALKEPPGLMTHITYNGGIWVPRDPAGTPRLYTYFTTQAVPPVVPPDTATCATVQLVRDPKGQGVDAVTYTTVGVDVGLSSAFAMQNAGTVPMSTGQAAGAGVAGGIIGGLIISSMINNDLGKIILQGPEKNVAFNDSLRAATARIAPLPAAIPASGVAGN
ncbi:hypothetical protein CDL60_12830 [Roseateles noduli]|nr:hypothetical protein CDL60_12830 [Roseateles noduli]